MAHICESCVGTSIVQPNPPSNSTSTDPTLIPFTIDTKVDLGAPTLISNASTNFTQEKIIQEHCVHGCKRQISRLIENEPHRIQFRPIKYSGQSRIRDDIYENFSEILVDGVPNTHLAMCKCKRLIVRGFEFIRRVYIHFGSVVHSTACPPTRQETKEVTRIDEPL